MAIYESLKSRGDKLPCMTVVCSSKVRQVSYCISLVLSSVAHQSPSAMYFTNISSKLTMCVCVCVCVCVSVRAHGVCVRMCMLYVCVLYPKYISKLCISTELTKCNNNTEKEDYQCLNGSK